ncbi:MAG: hypothetical protein IJQ02_02355 [Oscillospiraceae bacterium]|nr:hypothetical protein [Oscillospiraceae bacterium]
MIDFHTHILPGMDDGAADAAESLEMLRTSFEQGVDTVFATSHFYADEEDPASFLRRRDAAFRELREAYANVKEDFGPIPTILPGAEILYFPGMADCEELKPLALGTTGLLLIEPPVAPFSSTMLDEIEAVESHLGLVPVIAHLDRYCRLLNDFSLFDRLSQRRVLIQVNGSFFLHRQTERFALEMLEEEMFQFLGSDCHNVTTRPPCLGAVSLKIRENKKSKKLAKLNEVAYNVLSFS